MKFLKLTTGCFGLLAGLGLWLNAGALRAATPVGIGQNFTASTFGVDSPYVPADSNGAIGPNHFVEFINGRYSVYNKLTGARVQTFTDTGFWSAAGVTLNAGWDVSDPRVIFDPTVGRWFAAQIDLDPSGVVNANHFLIAVSAGTNPAGLWRGVSFTADPTTGNFADFPTFGLDANGVYLAADMFNAAGSGVGTKIVSIPKADLLGVPPSVANRTSFPIASYTARGEIVHPSVCIDGTGSGNLLAVGSLGLDFLTHTTLKASTILNAAGPGAATLPAATTITVSAYSVPLNPSQPDGSANLDDGDARIGSQVQTVRGVMFAVHGTQSGGRAAIRWYRINATNYAVIQSGTITDANLALFFPSIAANTNGAVVIACNGSSLSQFVSSYAFVGQTVGGVTTFGSPILLKAGVASYQNTDASGISRWGDYSTTSVDPADPTRFWTIQMYASGPSAWSTQVSEILTGLPRLAISRTGGSVLLAWPSYNPGFQLQSTPLLAGTNLWTDVAQPPSTNGNVVSVQLPAGGDKQFFRLKQAP